MKKVYVFTLVFMHSHGVNKTYGAITCRYTVFYNFCIIFKRGNVK